MQSIRGIERPVGLTRLSIAPSLLQLLLLLRPAKLTCAKILCDHEAVVSGIAGLKTRDAKFVLWKRLASVLHRTCFEVAWVPGHGRARLRHVPDVWRLLNNAADHAAEDVSKRSLARTGAWASFLSRRRRLVLRLLRL